MAAFMAALLPILKTLGITAGTAAAQEGGSRIASKIAGGKQRQPPFASSVMSRLSESLPNKAASSLTKPNNIPAPSAPSAPTPMPSRSEAPMGNMGGSRGGMDFQQLQEMLRKIKGGGSAMGGQPGLR